MGETVYIYGLHAPDDYTVMYVGSTLNPSARLSQHVSQPANVFEPVSQYHNSKKRKWIDDLLADGLRPEMVILEECTALNRDERENFWINYHGERNPELTNFRTHAHRKSICVSVRVTDEEHRLICDNLAPLERTEILLSAAMKKASSR